MRQHSKDYNKIPPAILACIVASVILMLTLFVKPYIGMADNGDYYRILSGNGLYTLPKNFEEQYFGYFNKEYGIYQYFNENQQIITTSQSLFIRGAIVLDEIFTNDKLFDIRFLAGIEAIYCLLMIYFLVKYVTYNTTRKKGYFIALLVPCVFLDTAYTAYFNSFYSEGIVYVSCIFCLVSILLMKQKQYNDYFLLMMFFINALILTTSKQQNAPNGVLLGGLIFIVFFITKDRVLRWLTAMIGIGLIAMGIGSYMIIPKEFVNINKYHAMTRGILLVEDDPEQALSELNINTQFSILKDTIYYERYPNIDVENPVLKEEFYAQYGFGRIAFYYVQHPDKLMKMLDLSAKNAFTIRPKAMGNYEKTEGKKFMERTKFFSIYSIAKEYLMPKTIGFIIFWMSGILAFYVKEWVEGLRIKEERGILKLSVLITSILIGLIQILVSIIGAGDADLMKHVFLFNVAFDLINLILISDVIKQS